MLVVVGLLALGVVVGQVRSLPDEAPVVLDKVALWLSFPAVVLDVVPTLRLDADALVPVGTAWGTLVLLVGLVLVLSRMLSWDRRTTGTMLLCVPLGNTSFLGIPAVAALLGQDHVGFTIVYDQFGSFLALATYGTFIAARYGDGARPGAGETLRRIVLFPPFVALVVALVARRTGLPAVVEDLVDTLAVTLVPVTMLAVGLRLWPLPTQRFGTALTGLVLRMGVAPAAVFGVAVLVGGTGMAWDTSILEAAMPPMVTASVVAADAGLDARLAAAMVGFGVVVGVLLVLPAWASLL